MKFKPLVGNLFLRAAIVSSIVSCNASSQTQNVNSDPGTCENTIASVKSELESEGQLTVEISKSDDASNYADYPQDRPDSYLFVVGGDAANSIMSADTLQNSVATKVIENCKSVSLVKFALDQTHYVIDHGLMPNGKVKKFECIKGFDAISSPTIPQWGEVCRP